MTLGLSHISVQSLAPQLFAASLFPYLGFLWFLTKSGKVPQLTVYGFYFLLVFVGATIPAGIYGELGNWCFLGQLDIWENCYACMSEPEMLLYLTRPVLHLCILRQ